MKLYLVIGVLALLAAATLGYVNGKGSKQTEFVDACLDRKFAVIYDAETRAHRHFHCFELKPRARENPPRRETVRQLLHL